MYLLHGIIHYFIKLNKNWVSLSEKENIKYKISRIIDYREGDF